MCVGFLVEWDSATDRTCCVWCYLFKRRLKTRWMGIELNEEDFVEPARWSVVQPITMAYGVDIPLVANMR